MQTSFKVICCLACAFVLLSGNVSAQHIPDADILLQEQRQTIPTLPDRLPSEDKKEVVQPPLMDTGVKILVKGFRFTGSYEGMAIEAELLFLRFNSSF